MSTIPVNLRYTEDHEWVKLESDGTVKIGITDHAQKELGDLVFVELPTIGDLFHRYDECGTVESVKAVSVMYCPISGKVIARNEKLVESPEAVNEDAYAAWFFSLRPDFNKDLDELLDAKAYAAYLEEAKE